MSYDVDRLRIDEEYFEETKIELAEKIQTESDSAMLPVTALELAQDQLLSDIWG